MELHFEGCVSRAGVCQIFQMVPVFRSVRLFLSVSLFGSFEFRLVSQSVNLLFPTPSLRLRAATYPDGVCFFFRKSAVMAAVCALLCCDLAGSEHWRWVSLYRNSVLFGVSFGDVPCLSVVSSVVLVRQVLRSVKICSFLSSCFSSSRCFLWVWSFFWYW